MNLIIFQQRQWYGSEMQKKQQLHHSPPAVLGRLVREGRETLKSLQDTSVVLTAMPVVRVMSSWKFVQNLPALWVSALLICLADPSVL